MIRAADLPDTIPIFPLPGALLLPRARLPLHIFEPRYLAMLDDVLKAPSRLIGMIQPVDTTAAPARFANVGCAGRVVSFAETEDGRYMITLAGISRFRLGPVVEGFAPYLRTEPDWSRHAGDIGPAETDPGLDRRAFFALLSRAFAPMGLKVDWDALKAAEDELLVSSLAMLCPFDPKDKQALLEAPDLPARRATLEALLEFAARGGGGEERMQ